MRALAMLKWTTAAFLLVGAAEALFKKWKNVPPPPGECVLTFDYCKIGCSYCTRCYVNFIDCALKQQQNQEEALQNRTDLCITALDKCKGSCTDCTPCYTMFIDCKQQMNFNGSVPIAVAASVNNTVPDVNATKNVTEQGTNINTSNGNEQDGGIGKVNSLEHNAIDIGMPGVPVFVVDKGKLSGLSRSDINEFYDAAVEISELLNSYGVYDASEKSSLVSLVQEDHEFHRAGSRVLHHDVKIYPPSDSEQNDERMNRPQNLESLASQVNLEPVPVVAQEINEDAVNVPLQDKMIVNDGERLLYLQDVELIPPSTDESRFHETERILLVPNDSDSLLPGTDNPAADQHGTDNPAADQPGTDNPAADQPGTDNPAADEPGTDNPAADEPGTEDPSYNLPLDLPVRDAEFQGANVQFPQESAHHDDMKIAFEDPYHIDPRLVR